MAKALCCCRSGRGILGSLMLVLWLSLGLISALPRLHHWFHHDSGTPQHECLATTVSKGGVLALSHGVPYVSPSSWLVLSASGCAFIRPLVSYALPLTRGPPVSQSLH